MQFKLFLAFRRDYDWGNRYGEQCADTSQVFVSSPCSFQDEFVDYSNNYLKFPAGYGLEANSLVTTPLCDSPFDTGDRPTCPPSVTSGTMVDPGRRDPFTNQPIPYFLQPNTTLVPCEIELPGTFDQPDYCAPWYDTFGFFFGDGDFHDIELRITDVNHDDAKTGNFLYGVTSILHNYPSPKKSDSEPWIAFFTGGNRLNYIDSRLNNNNQGRYRIETVVNIQGDNHSPIATALPVVPVPYTGRSANLQGLGMMATFEVAAYDPDINPDGSGNEQVKYYLANWRQQGALLANAIPEGYNPAPPGQWFKEDYERLRAQLILDSARTRTATRAASSARRATGASRRCRRRASLSSTARTTRRGATSATSRASRRTSRSTSTPAS